MEGVWRESDNVRDEGSSHECQGSECIVLVPRVLRLVWRTVPRKVEEEVGVVGGLFLWEALSTEGGEGGTMSRKPCGTFVDLRRGTNEPEACEAAVVANQTGKRGEACLPVETNRICS